MKRTVFCLTIAFLTGLSFVAMPASQAADAPKTPAGTKPADSEYRLGPEDVIDVFVWKEPELSTSVVVRPDGRISLPLANELDASGKTAVELQKEISDRLAKFILQPVVNVIVKQVNSMKISVLGEVRKPGVYLIKNRVTVLDAIAMGGGFTDLAKPSEVVVLRDTPAGQKRYRVNIRQLVADDSGASQMFLLQPMDTVYVK